MMKMNYFTSVNVIRAVMKFVKEKQPAETVEDGYMISGLPISQKNLFPEKIVLVGSVLSMISFIGYSSYAGSKYAIRGLADGLRSELKPYGTQIHIYLPANMDTPGFQIENITKPAITKQLDGQASCDTPQQAARAMLGGLMRGRYCFTNDLLGELIRVASNGAAPRPNPVTEIFAVGFISTILEIWVHLSDMDVRNYFKKLKK
ncbi:3-dehydrosphinganine reductase [Blyttiomyces sp. JEL0837]|nr:3-dehydrosphinganine reductase [Blyttiomyces sp. JEL0837]